MQNILKQYEELQAQNRYIDMSRGKPCDAQLKLSEPMLSFPVSGDIFKTKHGVDTRNYGILEGIDEARELMAELVGERFENTLVIGSSSLQLEYDTIARYMQFGACGEKPWSKASKFICLVPGYDRHFDICKHFGIEMIPVQIDASEDQVIDEITSIVKTDCNVKGIWCVPQYTNPSGITFSDTFVRALASMDTAAPDFRIFWDNAYCVHHLYEKPEKQDAVLPINVACESAGNENRYIQFWSTSKITFPGAGISAISSSSKNIADFKNSLKVQMIGSDKINQLRHVHFLKDKKTTLRHMSNHAEILRPKFDAASNILSTELAEYDCVNWSKPKGGYFISFNSAPNTARQIVELCKNCGVTLTPAGSTWPNMCDVCDSNIRIAPSMPSIEELEFASKVLAVSTKIAIEEVN